MFVFIYLFFLFAIILFVVFLILDNKQEKVFQQKRDLEIKRREETDVVFRYRDIPDELLADEYLTAKFENNTDHMEDMKKVMLERSKKASFEEAFEYYYKIYDEWRTATNYGCW